MNHSSPLLSPWKGPYGGVPPWNLVQPNEFIAAFKIAIEQASEEIDAIANQSESATFANTIVPLETAGETLDRLEALFDVHVSNLNLGPIPDVERVVVPLLSEYSDSVTQNSKLFQRIKTVYEGSEMESLSETEQRLVTKRFRTFVRKGARLSDSDKVRLTQINMRLARLFTDFSQNLLADERAYVTWIDDKSDLAGLPNSVVASMASAAADHGKPEQWAITNTRSSMEPFLTYANNRSLRQEVWTKYYNRGDNRDEHDNNGIISEILSLRLARAKLLGYTSHAHWQMEPTMAKTPDAATQLMMKVWPKAIARVREEVADMQAIADREAIESGNPDAKAIQIEPWDYRYYAEKVRKEKYDLDFNQVKPYLQLEQLREGMMWAASQLFGLQFKKVTDLPVFHPDVRVWEVADADGQHVGLWYFDPYARDGKRSGAWMAAYRSQHNIATSVTPIVSNNSNFIQASDDQPELISWDDAVTLFHEFGHALHGLCSQVTYPSQAGTNVPQDYVEFPSQIYEYWLSTPEVLNRFATHHQTDQPMPQALLEKIKRAETFNEGFTTVEYLASALVDMQLHLAAGDKPIDPDAFEKDTLRELGMPREIVMRHRTPQFAHLFSSDSYSAGYYSYLWSDALTADAAEAFEEAGNYFVPEIAKRLLDNVLSVGDTIDPGEGFQKFRGRNVDTAALLRKRGFPVD